jgi:hypothetical protein
MGMTPIRRRDAYIIRPRSPAVRHRQAAVGLGAVFGGTTVVLLLLGLLYQLALIALALPFALATAMMYWHASGRLLRPRRASERAAATDRPTGQRAPSPTRRRAAARELGVAVDADRATVRAAYRAAVREHHPDRPDGDRSRFDALQRAYALLTEEG